MRVRAFNVRVIAGVLCGLVASTGVCAAKAGNQTVTYAVRLAPLNTGVTKLNTTATAQFAIKGDVLTISVEAQGLPPGMMHLQHFHGFKDNHAARCPTRIADTNHDGVIDLIETEPMAGTTMVPLHDDPAGMEIVRDT